VIPCGHDQRRRRRPATAPTTPRISSNSSGNQHKFDLKRGRSSRSIVASSPSAGAIGVCFRPLCCSNRVGCAGRNFGLKESRSHGDSTSGRCPQCSIVMLHSGVRSLGGEFDRYLRQRAVLLRSIRNVPPNWRSSPPALHFGKRHAIGRGQLARRARSTNSAHRLRGPRVSTRRRGDIAEPQRKLQPLVR